MDRAHPEAAIAGAARLRLFARTLPEQEAELELAADAAQHARVLRLEPGAEVELFDGAGATVRARVVQIARGGMRVATSSRPERVARSTRIVLVQCVPKAGKLDDIVRMTTELGVAQIALASSEYCVGRRSEREEARVERLERIAIEAARQSEQPFVPTFSALRPLAEVVGDAPSDAFRAAFVERSAEPLPPAVEQRELWLVIGPEGGLSARDRSVLQAADFTSFALGRSILRTETAAVVGVALALDRLGRRC